VYTTDRPNAEAALSVKYATASRFRYDWHLALPLRCEYLVDEKREARFPFKRNYLRCVRCVNENRKKRKQPIMVATACFDRAFLLAGACVCCVKLLQAPANRNARSKQ